MFSQNKSLSFLCYTLLFFGRDLEMELNRERFKLIICPVLADRMQTVDGDVTEQLNQHHERNLYDLNLDSVQLEA